MVPICSTAAVWIQTPRGHLTATDPRSCTSWPHTSTAETMHLQLPGPCTARSFGPLRAGCEKFWPIPRAMGASGESKKVAMTRFDVGAPRGNRTPNPLIKRSQRRRRSRCSWACEGANSGLWTAADVAALLSLLLSRRVQNQLTSSLIGRASSFDQDRYTGARVDDHAPAADDQAPPLGPVADILSSAVIFCDHRGKLVDLRGATSAHGSAGHLRTDMPT